MSVLKKLLKARWSSSLIFLILLFLFLILFFFENILGIILITCSFRALCHAIFVMVVVMMMMPA